MQNENNTNYEKLSLSSENKFLALWKAMESDEVKNRHTAHSVKI